MARQTYTRAGDFFVTEAHSPSAYVTLLGAEISSPAVPNANYGGKLYIEPAGLIFKPYDTSNMSLAIAWDNIERCDWDIGQAQGIEGLIWAFLVPLIVLTMGLVSPFYAYVWVVYWDDYYGSEAQVWFKVGPHYERSLAADLAHDIWTARGRWRQGLKDAMAVQKRRW